MVNVLRPSVAGLEKPLNLRIGYGCMGDALNVANLLRPWDSIHNQDAPAFTMADKMLGVNPPPVGDNPLGALFDRAMGRNDQLLLLRAREQRRCIDQSLIHAK